MIDENTTTIGSVQSQSERSKILGVVQVNQPVPQPSFTSPTCTHRRLVRHKITTLRTSREVWEVRALLLMKPVRGSYNV